MATDNRLTARVQPSHADRISSVAEDREIPETEAERVVVREGLASLGYVEKPSEDSELLLYYVRRIGLVLGFVGLILVGYGIFGPRVFSVIGFGLVLAGFVGVALEEFLRQYGDDNVGES
jgi:hypothetical protein